MQVIAVVSDSERLTDEKEKLVKLQCRDKELGPVMIFLEQGVLPAEENISQQLTIEVSISMWLWRKCYIRLIT